MNHESKGFALVPAMFMVVIAAGLALVLAMAASSSKQLADTQKMSIETEYLATGAIEIAKQELREGIAKGVAAPAGGTAMIDGIAVPYTIAAVGAPSVTTDASGFRTSVQTYRISATAEDGGFAGTVNRLVNARTTALFQYVVFYEQSLDIMPGPSMVLRGRIHTNGDLRLGCGSSSTLSLDSNHVRVAGGVRRHYRHLDSPTNGAVEIRRWVENPFDGAEPVVYEDLENRSEMSSQGVGTVSGYDSEFAGHDDNGDDDFDDIGDWKPFDAGILERYSEPTAYPESGNTLLTGAHGVAKAVPPPVASKGMFEAVSDGDHVWDAGAGEYIATTPGSGTHRKGFFHDNADLAIVVADDGSSWTAVDGDGFDQTAALSGVVTIDQTYDARQGGYVRVAKLDVAALNASTAFPANGLLYVSHYGMGTGTGAKGVHLVNGSQVAADLTVVTEGSAYVQGDFNTVAKKSAAVVCDAVNLLSNSWFNGPTEPNASATTYNLAIVCANTETTDTTYNGGLENLPRFHEDWSGVLCTLRGSMNSVWEAEYATGLRTDARYSAPIRDYGYDEQFNDVANLPPFAPMLATVEDVIGW